MSLEERDRIRAEMRAGRQGSVFGSCLQVVGIMVVAVLMLIGVSNLVAPGWFPPSRRPTPTSVIATPTPVVPVVVERVRALSRLETMQYTMEWVIDQRREVGGIIPGSERLLLIVHGQVTAGLDLGRVGPGDITVNGASATINLPAAEVFSIAINNERSYVYDYRKDWWVKGEPVELVGDALVRAEREIGQAAISDGILGKAAANGESYLRHLLSSLGFTDVRLVTPTPTPTLTPTVNLTPVAPSLTAPLEGPSAPMTGPVSIAETPRPAPASTATFAAATAVPGVGSPSVTATVALPLPSPATP